MTTNPESGWTGKRRKKGDTDDWRSFAQETNKMMERHTICLGSEPGKTIHHGDSGFVSSVKELYGAEENNAAECFVVLKARLAGMEGDDFWSSLTKELAHILGAQYVLVSKRILPGHVDTVIEMPDVDEPGSCFSAVSMYFNDGTREEHTRGFKYPSKGSVCAHMKHDKVFLVPRHLADYMRERASFFQVPVESHFAIPFCDRKGRCFAHLGVFWSVEGEKARNLSWGFIEMMLHALEDLCTQRLLAVRRSSNLSGKSWPAQTVATRALTSMHSLKPYARSLSHELRTPMHGVVGMLDIMHATVQEALESPPSEDVAQLLRTIKENIETTQDSSRRAVEAADNIVHAYDFDMQVPGNEGPGTTAAVVEEQTVAAEEQLSPPQTLELQPLSSKRRRSGSLERLSLQPSPKHRVIEMPPRSATPNMAALTPHTAALHSIVKESSQITEVDATLLNDLSKGGAYPPLTPGAKFTRVREIVQVVVSESLRFGGRPDSAIATETELGEHIEVRNRGSNGDASTKIIDWSVEQAVPDEILIDERDFAKLISVLFLNALKFTEQGTISLHVSLSPRTRFVVINVEDTGMGIPSAFRPYLFKAFARGDDSLTRQNEGLGLGLMVAKSLARRVGGDLVCVRSDTRGAKRGSEFELRIPLTPISDGSRSQTPSRTPTPVRRLQSTTPHLSEPLLSAADAVDRTDTFGASLMPASTSSTSASANGNGNSTTPHTSPPTPAMAAQPYVSDAATPRRLSQSVPQTYDRSLAQKLPLNVMVAEDNKINRKLLVNMLNKLGYMQVHEAFDGAEAVRLMEMDRLKPPDRHIDVILMDLWMPHMDGYEAAERILAMQRSKCLASHLKILAVTADVTDTALDRARAVGMHGIMTKPYNLMDLERLIVDYGPHPEAKA